MAQLLESYASSRERELLANSSYDNVVASLSSRLMQLQDLKTNITEIEMVIVDLETALSVAREKLLFAKTERIGLDQLIEETIRMKQVRRSWGHPSVTLCDGDC